MDSFLDILITIALLALFSFPSLLKKMKEQPPQPAKRVYADISEEEDETDPARGSVLHNSAQDIPKQNEYFTYETLDDELERPSTKQVEEIRPDSQQVENKEENDPMLSLNRDEVLKGIIYSEILKRKF